MALRLPRTTSADERLTVWKGVAERVYDEQVRQGWRHQVFRLLRAVFNGNRQLSDEGGFLFNWAAENYLDAALMCIRRELDVQDGTENLRNLLEDIAANPDVLTRARYIAQWPLDDQGIASRVFDTFDPVTVPGDMSADYIGPDQIRTDLATLSADAERVRLFAERTRAHRTPKKGIDRTVTFRDLHRAIRDIREVVGKYYALLTLRSVAQWEPAAQYDTIAPFMKPWVIDPEAVADAADAEAKDDTPDA